MILAKGPHPFPFRTRQLSPSAPMVLRGRPRGRVGRRRGINFEPRTSSWAFLFVSKATQIGSAALPGAPASGPPPSSARSGPASNGRVGRRLSLSRRVSEAKVPPSMLLRSRLLREAVPPPGLTPGLKSHCEPRRRRRFPEEVMGDEHGRKVLAPTYPCEEPSAAAGFPVSRPAAACRRGKLRRLRSAFQHY